MKLRIITWVIMIFGGAAVSIYTDLEFFPEWFGSLPWHVVSFIVGAALMRMVIIISRNTGRTLARYGKRGDIPRMETNVLVKEGVYKHMRHPMHLGLMFFPWAFAFLFGSPTFILIVAPLEAVFILVMIKLVEEPEAIKKFNGEYLDYMKSVPSFCFRKECLKALFKKVEQN